MKCFRHRFLAIHCCLIAVIGPGCKGEVPVPAKPSAKNPEDDSQSPPANEPSSSTISANEKSASSTKTEDTSFVVEDGFTSLLRDQFEAFGAESDTWQTTDDGLSCTGKPRGYLYSKESYEDFTWRLDYRFPRPKSLKDDTKFKGNTGFLVYINGEQKLWPSCIEVQGKFVQMAAIKENGGAEAVTVDDNDAARQEHRKPVGEWNSLDITSKAGSLTVLLNGHQISASQPGPLTRGQIGIQSEDHPFEVRRMRIRMD